MNPRSLRLAVFASHPIQYQAPVWRRLAKDPRVDLLVHYFSDMSVRGAVDPDFGVPVAWDQPLLDGYRHVFLARDSNLGRPLGVKLRDLEAYLPNFDAVFINGYSYGFELQIRRAAPRLGVPLIMRPEVSAIPAGSPFRRFTRRLLQRWFFSGVDAFGVLGEQARRCLASAGVPPGKMFRSPYAVDSDVFQPNPLGRKGARRMLGVSSDRFLLMFSGKLIPRKNPRLVLQALERMPERSRISFLVVGDGPLRAQLEREGRRILGGNILFAGFQNQSRLS
ncbi:MAG TPA: glycosyltransferase, partial [Bryobacteraceae bacterium]|nr:glycosyltransferase [Bryobacteraceae bacterium]